MNGHHTDEGTFWRLLNEAFVLEAELKKALSPRNHLLSRTVVIPLYILCMSLLCVLGMLGAWNFHLLFVPNDSLGGRVDTDGYEGALRVAIGFLMIVTPALAGIIANNAIFFQIGKQYRVFHEDMPSDLLARYLTVSEALNRRLLVYGGVLLAVGMVAAAFLRP